MSFNFLDIWPDWQRFAPFVFFVSANGLFLLLLLRMTRNRPNEVTIPTTEEIADVITAVPQAPILQTLDQLRSFIRSVLFATHVIAGGENGGGSPMLASIFGLDLDKATLPEGAPKDACRLLDSIVSRVTELRLQVDGGAPGSDISSLLIAINADARALSAMLAPL